MQLNGRNSNKGEAKKKYTEYIKKMDCTNEREVVQDEDVSVERKKREKIADNLYELSGLVPGSNKRDEASILTKTVEYMKHMQGKVKALEEQVIAKDNNIEAEPGNTQSKLESVSGASPEGRKIEIEVFKNTFIIRIQCFQAGKETLVKTLNFIESLHLRVITSNSVQFSETTLELTITSQVEDGFEIMMSDIFKSLKSGLESLL